MTDRRQRLLQLLESSPADSFLLFALAKEFEAAGEKSQALEYYMQLQQSDPGYVGLYYHLGKLYESREDYTNAIQTYKNGIAISRKAGDQHAASELAGALLNLEDPDE